jgi:hypothetical protein
MVQKSTKFDINCKLKKLLLILCLFSSQIMAFNLQSQIDKRNCETGHWVNANSHDGAIVMLEDNSVWEVIPLIRLKHAYG